MKKEALLGSMKEIRCASFTDRTKVDRIHVPNERCCHLEQTSVSRPLGPVPSATVVRSRTDTEALDEGQKTKVGSIINPTNTALAE